MNAIPKLSLSQFTVSELLTTAKSSLTITKPLLELHPIVNRQTEKIAASVKRVVDIDNTEQKSDRTDPIRELDDTLDELIPLCVDDLKSNVKKKRYNASRAESSKIQLNMFDKRDRHQLYYGGYTNQGREVSALLADIFAPENDEHREKSGIADMLNHLKETYTELERELEARLNEGNLSSTLKDEKAELRYRLEKLFHIIDVNIVDDVEGFSEVQVPVNELISSVMAEYRGRITRKENKSK